MVSELGLLGDRVCDLKVLLLLQSRTVVTDGEVNCEKTRHSLVSEY